MLHILLAGREHDILVKFGADLCRIGKVGITQVDSAAAALKVEQSEGIDLVVVGQALADTTPVECVARLVRQNPMTNCAMVSAMEQNEFHEATEGLGVLMQLPPNPSADDALALLTKVEALSLLFDWESREGTR